MRIAGLDLSMTSTGVAVVDLDRPLQASVYRIRTPSPKLAKGQQPTLDQRQARLQAIEDGVALALGAMVPGTRGISRLVDIAFVEQPPFGSSSAYSHDISGSWWRVVSRVLRLGVPVVEVGNTKVKVYATGGGATRGPNKVEKRHIIGAVQSGRYGVEVARQIDGEGSDVADAFILAAIGARLLGHPVELTTLPQTHLRALENIHLPEGFTCP
jgi:crossover junction endodeoxyribonuclease RuvC